MIINHNLSALNAHRQLGVNTGATSKALEKLSSGLRINRAADDAAGLAISEKMRGQIRGLEQAQRNAQDSISLIQTAEGALNESHAILQRMRELAVQSANDTNTADDRLKLQAEIDQLAEELTRIASTTEFNTQSLLDGTFEGTFHIGANATQNINLTINNMSADALGVEGGKAGLVVEDHVGATSADQDIGNFAVTNNGEYSVVKLTSEYSATVAGESRDFGYALVGADGNYVGLITSDGRYAAVADAAKGNVNDLQFTNTGAATALVDFGDGYAVTSGTVTATGGAAADNVALTLTAASAVAVYSDDFTIASGTYTVVDDNHAFVSNGQFGLADANGNLVAYSANGTAWTDLSGNALFNHNLSGAVGEQVTIKGEGGIDISTQASADAAITTINNALETVSAQRSALGAVQNRLEHTINNLGAAAENLTAAESRIRDVDMAKEIMEFTKNNILTQAAQAMLAQANQQPQGVLQLLR